MKPDDCRPLVTATNVDSAVFIEDLQRSLNEQTSVGGIVPKAGKKIAGTAGLAG
jgi:hypothetical protein